MTTEPPDDSPDRDCDSGPNDGAESHNSAAPDDKVDLSSITTDHGLDLGRSDPIAIPARHTPDPQGADAVGIPPAPTGDDWPQREKVDDGNGDND